MSEIWQSVILVAMGLVMIYYGANRLITGSVAIVKKLNISYQLLVSYCSFGDENWAFCMSNYAACNTT